MSVYLIAAGERDAGILAKLHAQCFDAGWDEKAMRELLAAGTTGWIAGSTLLEPPQGFVLQRIAADEAEILSIGVAPSARTSGLGRVLLNASVDDARQRGVRTMFLDVATDNVAALALYAKVGFQEIGRRRGYYARAAGPAVDALVMTLAVARA